MRPLNVRGRRKRPAQPRQRMQGQQPERFWNSAWWIGWNWPSLVLENMHSNINLLRREDLNLCPN